MSIAFKCCISNQGIRCGVEECRSAEMTSPPDGCHPYLQSRAKNSPSCMPRRGCRRSLCECPADMAPAQPCRLDGCHPAETLPSCSLGCTMPQPRRPRTMLPPCSRVLPRLLLLAAWPLVRAIHDKIKIFAGCEIIIDESYGDFSRNRASRA